MFWALSAPIIKSTITAVDSHWYNICCCCSSSSIGPRWRQLPNVLQPCWLIVLARLWKFPLAPPGTPTPTTMRETPSRERGNYVWEMASNFADKGRVPRHLKGSFTCHRSATWDWQLYFPSEGRYAEDFFALKNPTALLPLRRKPCWGIFRPEKSDGFGQVRTRELGYQRPTCYPQTTEAT
jgi:hypothetical protein